jgi:hypothetical protein
MLADTQLRTASEEGLKNLRHRISDELTRRRAGGEPSPEAPPVSYVVEQRAHADGWLQAEMRGYVRKDGTRAERGPYWYFRYHQQGRQRKLYLGRTDNPEAALVEKRKSGG